MGIAKAELIRREELYRSAQEVCERAGAIKECEFHSGTFIDLGDDDAKKQAYAIGTNMVKQGEVDGTREEFMNSINSALKDSVYNCPSCEKMMDD